MGFLTKPIIAIFDKADIKIGGKRDHDLVLHNPKLFRRVFWHGVVGFGEAYVDKWFDSKALDKLIYRVLASQHYRVNIVIALKDMLSEFLTLFINFQSIALSRNVAKKHYDIDTEIFTKMLDSKMIYSCGYWAKAKTLDQAQEHKLDLIACKLRFKKGMKVLDIGCGWGGSARYFAEKYGVNVTGITISKGQYAHAKTHNAHKNTKFLLCDYRKHTARYDAVYSIGMFEHVGPQNYQVFFQTVKQNLKKEGCFLLHTIGSNTKSSLRSSWLTKYIFPGAELPTPQMIAQHTDKLFMLDDWHNFGCDYDKTLMEWYRRFVKSYPSFQSDYYNERFFRIWSFYLLSCAGGFRARYLQLWQILLSPADSILVPDDLPRCR